MDSIEIRILDNLTSAVLLFDKELRVKYVNLAAEMLFAISSRALVGQGAHQLIRSTGAKENLNLQKAIADGHSFTERGALIQLPDHRDVTVDCTVTPITDGCDRCETLIELQQVDRQIRISREEQLLEQQKATVAVVRNLAHEIKNPLGGIRGAAQLLQEELRDPSQTEYTGIIIEEADRLQLLVNKLLGPNKKPAFGHVNIHQLLERVRHLITAEWGRTINVIRDFDPSIPELWAEPDQLIQALLNIARNAAKASQGKGDIVFRTRVQRQFTIGNKRHRLVLQIDIEDKGPGIPNEIKEQIFFPTVSGMEGGSGLGLSIAQSLISQHAGLIEYSSQPGKTIFTVLLPLEVGNV